MAGRGEDEETRNSRRAVRSQFTNTGSFSSLRYNASWGRTESTFQRHLEGWMRVPTGICLGGLPSYWSNESEEEMKRAIFINDLHVNPLCEVKASSRRIQIKRKQIKYIILVRLKTFLWGPSFRSLQCICEDFLVALSLLSIQANNGAESADRQQVWLWHRGWGHRKRLRRSKNAILPSHTALMNNSAVHSRVSRRNTLLSWMVRICLLNKILSFIGDKTVNYRQFSPLCRRRKLSIVSWTSLQTRAVLKTRVFFVTVLMMTGNLRVYRCLLLLLIAPSERKHPAHRATRRTAPAFTTLENVVSLAVIDSTNRHQFELALWWETAR